jgi:nucleoid-associated protein YgaU
MAIPEDRSKPAPPPAPGTGAKPAADAADNPYAQHYVVQKGDTLSKIAEEFYGDKMLYPQIFEANRDILSDPDKIKPGQKLRIP